MTANQIAYWNFRENERSNMAREAETSRTNRANEALKAQSNQTEIDKLAETKRSNLVSEGLKERSQSEVERHNLQTEGIDISKLEETVRSNRANEAERHRAAVAAETEAKRSNLAREAETYRANTAKEAENQRHNVVTERETSKHNRMSERAETIKVTNAAQKDQAQRELALEQANATASKLESEIASNNATAAMRNASALQSNIHSLNLQGLDVAQKKQIERQIQQMDENYDVAKEKNDISAMKVFADLAGTIINGLTRTIQKFSVPLE